MQQYRARPGDGVAWITGASSGIGRQVALDLARKGFAVAASARSADALEALAAEAAGASGSIRPFPVDVTDADAMAQTAAAIEREAGPLALAIFNAGTYQPTTGDRLSAENIVKTFSVNMFGAANGLAPAIERMRAHGRGQIALVGSLTSYFGLPAAGAYGASKAALNSLAQSLRHDLEKMNITIQVINPGFVDTPLTRKNDFQMPALLAIEDAAARIVSGLETGGFEIAFPRRLAWTMKAVRLLPQPAVHWLVNRATGWHKRPLKAPAGS